MISYKPSTLHTAASALIVAALMLPVQALASGTSMPSTAFLISSVT